MYRINTPYKKIETLWKQSFQKLQFTERAHLQEWIAKEPTCFGEELLIIQKEFAGFSDTRERLDLLALDKEGALVIIENKLDDSGKDVTGQALKYASYCSNFSKEYIKDIYQEYLNKQGSKDKAEEKLSKFFEERDYEDLELNEGVVTQRIILVAAKFSMEVTSTVLWLLNFNVHLQCFCVTPYSKGKCYSEGDELFLNFEKIIPPQDVEEWMIGMKKKEQANMEEKKQGYIRKEFWTELLERMKDKSDLFGGIKPGKDSEISKTSGIGGGVIFRFNVSGAYGRTCLYIDKGPSDSDKKATQFIYNKLLEYKEQIESNFGRDLYWDSMEGKQACRIKVETSGNVYDKEQWNAMITFMIENMLKLEKAIKGPLNEIKQKLKENPHELDLENEEENG